MYCSKLYTIAEASLSISAVYESLWLIHLKYCPYVSHTIYTDKWACTVICRIEPLYQMYEIMFALQNSQLQAAF
mgnify:CR=1 FL=1